MLRDESVQECGRKENLVRTHTHLRIVEMRIFISELWRMTSATRTSTKLASSSSASIVPSLGASYNLALVCDCKVSRKCITSCRAAELVLASLFRSTLWVIFCTGVSFKAPQLDDRSSSETHDVAGTSWDLRRVHILRCHCAALRCSTSTLRACVCWRAALLSRTTANGWSVFLTIKNSDDDQEHRS
jgi:hypothetical protein